MAERLRRRAKRRFSGPGGVDSRLNRSFSIGFRALYHGIYFTQAVYEHNPFLSTVSVEGNLQVHF